jgi:hypothetical protein
VSDDDEDNLLLVVFCSHIASRMLGTIGDQLMSKAEQLKQSMCSCDASDDESSPK